ncbi:MAG: cycloinulo-oligosaccharide fructanotransferase [Pirellula sp.]|nr:cycloinulo-oligosaccharide fructanotransferase [Pirellula sp.]
MTRELTHIKLAGVLLVLWAFGGVISTEAGEPAAAAVEWHLDGPEPGVKVHGTVARAAGAVGECLVVDGESLVELQESGRLNGGEQGFTFSVWFNPYDLDGGQQVIAAKNRYALGERQWSIVMEPGGTLSAYLSQGKWQVIATRVKPEPGRWHQATLTVGPAKAVLYVDGKPVGEATLAQPLAPTAAPITLGGVNDDGRLRQQLLGAVDEAHYQERVLTAEQVAAAYRSIDARHEIPKPEVSDVPLWLAEGPVPKAAALSDAQGVRFHVIKAHEPERDGYIWLHGVGLAWHKGKLYASFGHNKGSENTAGELACGRVSGDGGKTWSDTFTIGVGRERDSAVSHGVFLSHGGELWAFHGAFTGRMKDVHTRAYRLDESSGVWKEQGSVVDGGFWPMQEPLKMADGNWIMSGVHVGDGNPAAVAVSRGADLTKWEQVRIPKPDRQNMWGESTVIVDGARVMNIARFGGKPTAVVAVSEDYGSNWTKSLPSNLPMATSKPYAGTLSTGQRYLVCTTTADTGGRRAPLTIAVGRAGENGFRKIFRIRNAESSAGPGESDARASLSYPYAVEHDGHLYVGYSNSGGRRGNHNSAELAIVPVASLTVD